MRRRYLLDTNHLSAALNPVSRIRERLFQAQRQGAGLGTCLPVLCELEVGIVQTADPDENRRTLRVLQTKVRIWPLEPPLARRYAEVYHDLRQRGRALSQTDILLAAMALEMDLTLLTADRDFEAVPGLQREDWLAGDPAASPNGTAKPPGVP